MKRILIIIITLLISVCANAQIKGHMKFMGIPMGISINSFQNKLAAKGVKYDPMSRQMKDAVRMYNGKFAGYDATIFVYYDSKNQLVYRAKACIERQTKDIAEGTMTDIASMLLQKYGLDKMYHEDDEYAVYIDEGNIDLYVIENDADYVIHLKDYYTIHVDYYDNEAQNQNRKSRMDDL